MKGNILLLVTLFALHSSYAQTWSEVDVNTTDNLNKIHFTSDEKGYIIGNNGFLLQTIDGGNTWLPIELGVSHDLMTMSFITTEVGYINGLKTMDGGDTWVPQPSSEIFGMIHCIDENKIIAGHGDNFGGDIYQSIDGGDTWEISANPLNGSTGMYNDCHFVNAYEGYLVTWYSEHLFKTLDTGSTWSEIIIDEVDGNPWFSDDFRSVYFPTQDIGLVTHQSGILKTSNAGSTWSEIKPTNLSFSFYPESIIALSTENYIVVGGFPNIEIEKIYETTDGGASWTESVSIEDALFDVECTTRACFAVGSNGVVYRKEIPTNHTDERLDNPTVSLYPNPAQDFLQVEIENSSDITEIRIFNLEGQSLDLYPDNQNRIDIAQLHSGIYLCKVIADKASSTFKFIKE